MATGLYEKGLETLIVRHMIGTDGLPSVASYGTRTGLIDNVAAQLRRAGRHGLSTR